MASVKTLDDLLDSSVWTAALLQAGVATTGTADSFLKASHVTHTRPVASIFSYRKPSQEADEGQDLE